MSSLSFWGSQQAYAWRQTFIELWHEKCSSLLIIVVIAITFSLPSLSYVLWKNTQNLEQQFPIRGEMTLFLKKGISDQTRDQLLTSLRTQPGVEKAFYLSPQMSLQSLKQAGVEEAVGWFTDSQLPSAIVVQLKQNQRDVNEIQILSEKFAKLAGVDQVQFEKAFLQKISALSALFAKISTFCTLLMFISVVLIISNSIRAEVYSSKKQIEVMQILGATKGFIMRPFLYRGILFVVLGSFLGCLLSFFLLREFSQDVAAISALFHQKFQLINLTVSDIATFVLIGGLLGYFSANFSTLRYIKQLERDN